MDACSYRENMFLLDGVLTVVMGSEKSLRNGREPPYGVLVYKTIKIKTRGYVLTDLDILNERSAYISVTGSETNLDSINTYFAVDTLGDSWRVWEFPSQR